jgi:hypothetical protein
MPGAEDDGGRAEAADDEADIVGRADDPDLERRPAFGRGAERDQRQLQPVAAIS